MATKTKTKTTTRSTAPTFNLSALTIADAELPKQTRTGSAGPNPFIDVLAQSRDNGNAGKSVTVPAANVGQVQYLIRKAAAVNGVGARIVLRNSMGDALNKDAMKVIPKTASVTVLFAAKPRKQRRQNTEA